MNHKFKRVVKDILACDIEGRLSWSAWLSHGKSQPSEHQNSDEGIIVSLTTIPSRISRVHVCIESILRQAMRPSRVVLWLSAKQFPDLRRLPIPLLRQKTRGVEIYQCERDWPHKKLLPSLKKWPSATIITADDDVIYPVNWLQELYCVHNKIPDAVVCHRARIMEADSSGSLARYETWPTSGEQLVRPSHSIFPIGNGGILYPADALHGDVQNTALAEMLCPRADDIWFKVMAFRKGTMCVVTSTEWRMPPEIQGSQVTSLHKSNIGGGGNDKQLNAVLKYFDIEPKSFFESPPL